MFRFGRCINSYLTIEMHKMKKAVLLFIGYAFCFSAIAQESNRIEQKYFGWKAGVARTVITPSESMWMAGYASREEPATGTIHDLMAKALVIDDSSGYRALLITMDLVGIPKEISDNIRNRIEEKFQLKREQIILNSSHTHSGPVLQNALFDIYPLDSMQLVKIKKYSSWFEDRIIELVGDAISKIVPVRLFSNNGVTRFQVNRRNNVEATLSEQNDLNGPNDFAVPVIKILDQAGKLMSIIFGYACHPTVLDTTLWSGDYPGFAQLALEESHPGTTALFFQGAGADQNPMPRRTIPLARQFGKTLASAVERVLEEEMTELKPKLVTAYSEIDLVLKTPSARKLNKYANTLSDYQQRWAIRMRAKLNRGERLRTKYPYPIQLWKLGDQLIWSLAGETVISYAINIKKIFGLETFVMGYCNDIMSYIPSKKILREGGYEGHIAQRVYGLPGKWDPSIESSILKEIEALANKNGITRMERSTE